MQWHIPCTTFRYMEHTCHYLCSELITVTHEEQPGQIRQSIANLEEISTDRAVVLMDEQPRLGSSISLSIKGRDLFGVINAMLHDEVLGCYAVITLDPESRWNPDWFAPKHLLSTCPCSLESTTETKAPTLENIKNTEEIVQVSFLVGRV